MHRVIMMLLPCILEEGFQSHFRVGMSAYPRPAALPAENQAGLGSPGKPRELWPILIHVCPVALLRTLGAGSL